MPLRVRLLVTPQRSVPPSSGLPPAYSHPAAPYWNAAVRLGFFVLFTWLEGERGPDVSQSMVWIPFVSFWQVTADLVFAVDVPDGHGHKYEADYVNGWAAVAEPPGWTAADIERLRELIG